MTVPDETRRFIFEQLNRSALKRDAFDCRFDVDAKTAVFITLRGSEHNRFILQKTTSTTANPPWEVRESPGPLFRGFETSRFDTLEDAAGYIREWLTRLDEEAAL